jgi:hypothetical protein
MPCISTARVLGGQICLKVHASVSSKSNALKERRIDFLSRDEVAFGRRMFRVSRAMSQNALIERCGKTETRQLSAVSKSSIRSSLDSRPTDKRTRPSPIPARARSAADIPE